MRCEGNHAPLKGVAANPWLWLLRGDDNGLKMNRFHEELGANPRRSWLNSRNGKIRPPWGTSLAHSLLTFWIIMEDGRIKHTWMACRQSQASDPRYRKPIS